MERHHPYEKAKSSINGDELRELFSEPTNVGIPVWHGDVRASAVMTDDDDTMIFLTLSGKSSALHSWPHLVSTLITLLAVDSTVDFDRTPLLSSPSPASFTSSQPT